MMIHPLLHPSESVGPTTESSSVVNFFRIIEWPAQPDAPSTLPRFIIWLRRRYTKTCNPSPRSLRGQGLPHRYCPWPLGKDYSMKWVWWLPSHLDYVVSFRPLCFDPLKPLMPLLTVCDLDHKWRPSRCQWGFDLPHRPGRKVQYFLSDCDPDLRDCDCLQCFLRRIPQLYLSDHDLYLRGRRIIFFSVADWTFFCDRFSGIYKHLWIKSVCRYYGQLYNSYTPNKVNVYEIIPFFVGRDWKPPLHDRVFLST